MSTHRSVEQDERTVAVIGVSCQYAFLFFCLALPIDYAYRAIVRHENAWDLMALFFGGVAICLIHQVRQKILGKVWWVRFACIAAVAGITTAVVTAMTQDVAWIMGVTGVVTGITAAVVTAITQAK
jgi:energy-converting hydrogenase Eha subunit A